MRCEFERHPPFSPPMQDDGGGGKRRKKKVACFSSGVVLVGGATNRTPSPHLSVALKSRLPLPSHPRHTHTRTLSPPPFHSFISFRSFSPPPSLYLSLHCGRCDWKKCKREGLALNPRSGVVANDISVCLLFMCSVSRWAGSVCVDWV
ncbi:hypothetical protein NPIL_366431 [Nephila pilipes]|uniref:Uncharacterized protein n=1 Tax=Nephila pilipes TaxID=299642 RepID=A0A8X6U3I0_NEPPI|nr:hypothetical protein NPIL_366431 [Nephila pilipes]